MRSPCRMISTTSDCFASRLIEYLTEAPEDKPFFVYLAFTAPAIIHCKAPQEEIAKYRGRYADGPGTHCACAESRLWKRWACQPRARVPIRCRPPRRNGLRFPSPNATGRRARWKSMQRMARPVRPQTSVEVIAHLHITPLTWTTRSRRIPVRQRRRGCDLSRPCLSMGRSSRRGSPATTTTALTIWAAALSCCWVRPALGAGRHRALAPAQGIYQRGRDSGVLGPFVTGPGIARTGQSSHTFADRHGHCANAARACRSFGTRRLLRDARCTRRAGVQWHVGCAGRSTRFIHRMPRPAGSCLAVAPSQGQLEGAMAPAPTRQRQLAALRPVFRSRRNAGPCRDSLRDPY